jgi:hypothetical protein
LGLSGEGNGCCAVKFFLRRDDRNPRVLADKELENWTKVYGKVLPACRVGKLPNNAGYLCMPYLQPIPRNQRLQEMNNVKEALKSFAESGYKHNDIRWRHFGSYEGKMYLCDLGHIEELTEADSETWIEESLRLLEKKRIETEEFYNRNLSTPMRTERETPAALGISSGCLGPSKRKRD